MQRNFLNFLQKVIINQGFSYFIIKMITSVTKNPAPKMSKAVRKNATRIAGVIRSTGFEFGVYDVKLNENMDDLIACGESLVDRQVSGGFMLLSKGKNKLIVYC